MAGDKKRLPAIAAKFMNYQKEKNVAVLSPEAKKRAANKQALFDGRISNGSSTLFNYSYTGEKNMGEAGPLKNYSLDYTSMRIRSWDAFLDSEIAQLVIKRYITWLISTGLKVQSEPSKLVLEAEGITANLQEFSKKIEAFYDLYRSTTWADFASKDNLDMIAAEAFKNAIVGGDVLVIQRFIDGVPKIQLVDGCHVQSPLYGTESFPQKLDNGNEIKNGVEVSASGEHIAYHIRTAIGKFERIPAKFPGTDLSSAYLVYGMKYRLDNVRGIPLLAAVLETIKKMERYKEATLGSAEERAKIVLQITHDLMSDGSNPFLQRLATAYSGGNTNEVPIDYSGNAMANKVAISTNKQVFNMGAGSQLKALDSKSEIQFKEFYETNVDILCAVVNIPPDVATSKYDSNYSASRAAIKDWENTLTVGRKEFSFQFYRPNYHLFLEGMVIQNRIQVPGYWLARAVKNNWVIEAYRKARWVGSPVPHIDPLTEVKAERLKLGDTSNSIPLTTVEQAAENLNGGDSTANMEQYSRELQLSKDLDIKLEPELAQPITNRKKPESKPEE